MSLTLLKIRALSTLFLLCTVPTGWTAERHSAFGLVLQVDRAHHSIRVSCHEIPGYMDAMVKDFPVRNGKDLDGLEPGTLIDFTLVVEKDTTYATGIRIHQFQSTEPEPMAVRQLNLLEGLVGSGSDETKKLEIGERVSDFSLTDQLSQSISLSSFMGKVVGVTFIHPLPASELLLSLVQQFRRGPKALPGSPGTRLDPPKHYL